MCAERVQWGGLARACRWRPARGGWREGRVVDGRMLILDWRRGEDRSAEDLHARVCEGTVCGKGRQRSGPVAVEDGRTEAILYRDGHFQREREMDAI